MWRVWRLPLVLLLVGSIGYMAVSRLTFAAPATISVTVLTALQMPVLLRIPLVVLPDIILVSCGLTKLQFQYVVCLLHTAI
jgi:hypothetical protein